MSYTYKIIILFLLATSQMVFLITAFQNHQISLKDLQYESFSIFCDQTVHYGSASARL